MIKTIKVEELANLLPSEAILLVDVRELEEWKTGHLQGAYHWPLSESARAEFPQTEKEKIILYCQHGIRSLSAAGILLERGFREVYSLQGGLSEWESRFADYRISL